MVTEHVPEATLICEPIAKNTAASIGLAALEIRRSDPKRVMVVLPADHFIRDEPGLLASLEQAAALAATGNLLVALGITPTDPNTAYGYIKRGTVIENNSYRVQRFFEKPSQERALKYIDSGDFYWNSGMFAWSAESYLSAVKEHMPELYQALQTIDQAFGGDDYQEILCRVLTKLDSISVDFGILEHSKECAMVATGAIGWTDVGSWDAWADRFSKDAQGNLLHGDAAAIDSKNCVVYSKNRLIAVLGCEDVVVIDSKDALLVCPRSKVQDVRKVVDELKERGRDDLI